MSLWPRIDAFLKAKNIRIAPPTPCSTDGDRKKCPMHTPGSNHYLGTARDYGDVASDCHAIADALRPFAKGPDHILNELFYAPTGDWWKDGRNLTRAAIGDHDDHVHASILTGHDFPTVGKVTPMFDPPLRIEVPIAASLPCPTGGEWLLGTNGAIFAFDCSNFGAADGKSYFAGRTAARLELREPDPGKWSTASPPYRIRATSGEGYGDGGF